MLYSTGFTPNDTIFVNQLGASLAQTYGIQISQPNPQTIVLNGTLSQQNYEDVLREVMYDNTAEEPGDGTRTVETSIMDDVNNMVAAFTTINLTSTNDPAVLFEGVRTLTFDEQTRAPLSLFTAADAISDPDGSVLTWVYIAISNDTVGNFGYDNLTADFATTNLRIMNEPRTTLNISGTASFSDYESVLRTVTYSNIYPGIQAHPRIVNIQTFDGLGPAGNQTIQMDIRTFNDPPICYFDEVVSTLEKVNFLIKKTCYLFFSNQIYTLYFRTFKALK